MEQLQHQVKDLNTQRQLEKDENEAQITEFKSKAHVLKNQVKDLFEQKCNLQRKGMIIGN